ncbi:MAG TPA: SpoIID/LytB domain-containing protein [Candidatus Dormibacteraeota bacterium]|nr:SpoIID/LytB domain-containing protein [Candidatus Dormibacteraeota bacterium]
MRLDRRTVIRGAVGLAAALAVPRGALATGGILESDVDAAQLGATPPPISVKPLPGDAIRVLLAGGRPSIQLSSPTGLAVFDAAGSGAPVARAAAGQALTYDRAALARTNGSAIVEAIGEGPLSFDGHPYRGRLLLMADGGSVMVVNQLAVDLYVLGVLGREISPAWPASVLQAHAIISRTYALVRRKDAAHAFDVYATTADQVYGGMSAESPQGNDAVYQTRGLVLGYGGGLASAFFSSCCGGHTENAAALWGQEIPYLQGVADPYCVGAPHYRWRSYVTVATLRDRLGHDVSGDVTALQPQDIDPSGRAQRIAIDSSVGVRDVVAKVFRERIGTSVVRSTLIHRCQVAASAGQLQPDPAYNDPSPVPPPAPPRDGPLAMIEGAGWGHGVGLCQWGARGMALQGGTATQILAFYFPGTVILQHGSTMP